MPPRKRLDKVDAVRPMKQAGVISTHVLTFFAPAASSVSTGAVMLLTHFSREGFLPSSLGRRLEAPRSCPGGGSTPRPPAAAAGPHPARSQARRPPEPGNRG